MDGNDRFFSGFTIMILKRREKNKRIVIYTSLVTESERH